MPVNKLISVIKSKPHFKEIFKSGLTTFILRIAGMMMGYVIMYLISTNYGSEGVGEYSLAVKSITFLGMIAAMGTNDSVIRFVGQFLATNGQNLTSLYLKVIRIIVISSISISMLLWVSPYLLTDSLAMESKYVRIGMFLSITLPMFTINLVNVEFLRALNSIGISEQIRSVNRYLVLFILLLVLGGIGVNYVLFFLGIAVAVNFLFSTVWLVLKLPSSVKTSGAVHLETNQILKTSFPMLVTNGSVFLMANVPLYFIEYFRTTKEVGIFSVFLAISMLLTLVTMVVRTVIVPKFSKLYWSDQHQELQRLISFSSGIIFFGSLLLSVGLFAGSVFVLDFFGEEYSENMIPLYILLSGQTINSMAGPVGQLLNMTGHQKIFRNVVVGNAALCLVLSIILIPLFGITGAAVATASCMALTPACLTIYAKHKLKINTYYNPFLRI